MTPLLVALTGPARHEVARVLRAGCPGADPVAGASAEPWWGEVRDYLEAPRKLRAYLEAPPRCAVDANVDEVADGIHAVGGEPFLCDLVLPHPTDYCSDPHKKTSRWGCARCNFRLFLPDRLAVECREGDHALLDRVRWWGGQGWDCRELSRCLQIFVEGRRAWQRQTWLEAVRAVLPC